MTTSEPELAVVTGGTGGIGTAVCRDLGGRGYHVVELGRDAGALAALATDARAGGTRLTGSAAT